eukprot:214459-Prymnesium_polylepis.1
MSEWVVAVGAGSSEAASDLLLGAQRVKERLEDQVVEQRDVAGTAHRRRPELPVHLDGAVGLGRVAWRRR